MNLLLKKAYLLIPFFDDDMYDHVINQTAAIVDRELTLPINASISDSGKETKPWTLALRFIACLKSSSGKQWICKLTLIKHLHPLLR